MPVIIKEVHVKATVSNAEENSSANSNSAENSTSDEIVAVCVEKVLEILQDKMER